MRRKPIVRGIATVLLLLLVGVLRDQALHASGWSFNNSNVLVLLKEGASDFIIKTRIAEVPAAIFKYETEDLVALRNAGASLGVISAMLARSRQSLGSNFAPNVMSTFKSLTADTLPLVTRQGQQELGFSRGEYVIEGTYQPALHLDYPGLHAGIRTTDQSPSLLIRSDSDPATGYYLCKLYPVIKGDIRSLKVEVRTRHFRNVLVPAKGWMIAYTATEEEKGVWRITPKAGLEPGEYGVLDGVRLFGFGVDLQERTDSPPAGR